MNTATLFPPLSADARSFAYRLFALGLLCLLLAVASDAFLTLGNILNVLRQASLLFLLASGVTLVILTGGLDLSVGANVAMSACVAATVMKATGSTMLGVGAGLGIGALIGLANGLLVAMLRIRPSLRPTACCGCCTASPTGSWRARPSTAFRRNFARSAAATCGACPFRST